jgi:hypothetical protein
MRSETLDVHEYRLQHEGRTYVLIDTPGFDDSYRSNDEIVDAILAWLEKSYRAQKLLSGIIYLHRISDPRMQGSSLDNLRMFRKLCGLEALKNVLLVTTFWDTVSDAEGRRREQELSSNDEFWGRMIKRGSQMKRWSRSSRDEEGKRILSAVVPDARRALQAQIEIVDQGKRRNETDVARSTLNAMRIEMSARLEQEKLQMNERMERQQRQVRRQYDREKELLRQAAARERQIEEDARIAAEMAELDRLEAENVAAKQQLQRQIEQKQMESRQAAAKFQQEEARRNAQMAYYRNFPCHHSDAEASHKCDRCGVKLNKKQAFYYRKFTFRYLMHGVLTNPDCCHCSDYRYQFNYKQCSTCGVSCMVAEHPASIRKTAVDHSCILM